MSSALHVQALDHLKVTLGRPVSRLDADASETSTASFIRDTV